MTMMISRVLRRFDRWGLFRSWLALVRLDVVFALRSEAVLEWFTIPPSSESQDKRSRQTYINSNHD
jgi:hypothetical protein